MAAQVGEQRVFIEVPYDVTDTVALRRFLVRLVEAVDAHLDGMGQAAIDTLDIPAVTVSNPPAQPEVQQLADNQQQLANTVNAILEALRQSTIIQI